MNTACSNITKKCVGHSDSKPVQQCSSGVGRRDPDAGTAQLPTSTADQETVDIVNSRHVCGGKGSICEFLRSQPSQSSSDKVDGTTNASRSPGATATSTTFWDVAREVINSKYAVDAKDAGVSEPLRSKPAPAPSRGTVAGPVTVEHVAIVINIPTNNHRPASESCGQPEERETACEYVEPSRGAVGGANRMVCECFSMAEPYMQTIMGRPQPPSRDQEQRERTAKKSCPRRRRHSNASFVSQKAIEPPSAKSIIHNVKRPEPPPAIGAHQSNRNTLSCMCRCHLH